MLVLCLPIQDVFPCGTFNNNFSFLPHSSITPFIQSTFTQEGSLEVSEQSQNSRLGSALAPIPDMNGDGYRELVVGAPLEDDHQGAIYIFYGLHRSIQPRFKQVIFIIQKKEKEFEGGDNGDNVASYGLKEAFLYVGHH